MKKADWRVYFNEQKTKAEVLKTQIAQTDKEIDQMVYELYVLSEKVRKVVDGE